MNIIANLYVKFCEFVIVIVLNIFDKFDINQIVIYIIKKSFI